jgi:hypothetical protein
MGRCRRKGLRQLRAAVVAVVLAGLGAAPGASAQGTWAQQPAPSPDAANFAYLAGVSCPSEAFCMAVGHSNGTQSGGETPLSEEWDGTDWSIIPSPIPPGVTSAAFTDLMGISCTSPTACVAVGDSFVSGTTLPFVERWDGTVWTLEADPVATASAYLLEAVSCSAADACTAVGANSASDQPFVARWDGSAWTAEQTPDVGSGFLYAVSCPTDGSCVAAGLLNDATFHEGLPLAEVWDGSAWTADSPPRPDPSGSAEPFTGISCTVPAQCTAVGGLPTFGSAEAMRLHGTTWTEEAVPQPAPRDWVRFAGVSCAGASDCVAVGRTVTQGASLLSGTLGESWDGTSWSLEPTPEATRDPNSDTWGELASVSCPESGYCVAVGNSEFDTALVEVRQELRTPSPASAEATDVTDAGAMLNGTVDRATWAISSCRFEWGTSTAYGQSVPCTFASPGSAGPVTVSAAITGLTPSTNYHYRVLAVNGAGSAASADETFTTSAAPPVLTPPPPGGPSEGTFGNTAVGRHAGAFSAAVKRVNHFRLTRTGRLFELSIYLQPRGRRGTQGLIGMIYGNLGAKPSRLLARTRRLAFAGSDAAGWYHLKLRRPLTLRAGRYWLGLLTGATGNVAGYRYQHRVRARDLNANALRRGPSQRFGRFRTDDVLMSIYASYTLSTAAAASEPPR